MNTWSVVGNALPSLPPWAAGLGILFIVWIVLAMILKCYVVWHAAQRGEKWWFISLFFINTLGVLELIYLALHHRRPETPAPTAAPTTWQ